MGKIKNVDHTVDNPGMVSPTVNPMEQNSNINEQFSWAAAIRASVKDAGKGEIKGGTKLNKAVCKGTGRGE